MSTADQLPPAAFILASPLGSGQYTFHADAQRREDRITWRVIGKDDLETFIKVALYTPETVTFPGGSLTRYIPLLHPYAPPDTNLYAIGVDGRAFSPNDSDDVEGDPYPWKEFDVTVTFGPLAFAVDGDTPFVSIRGRANPKRITRPNTPYSLIDDSDAFVERVAQDITIPSGEIGVEVTWHEIVDLPAALAIVVPLLDRVNSTEVVIPSIGLTCPPGTLQFQTTDFGYTISNGNNKKSTLGISLLYRDREWNRAVASKDPYKGEFLRIDPPAFRDGNLNVLVGN